MPVQVLRNKTPSEVFHDVSGFAPQYVYDWKAWLEEPEGPGRRLLFGRILRKWQAARPRPMRRLRHEARHESPYLDDLIEAAAPQIQALGRMTVATFRDLDPSQEHALQSLWNIFSRLPAVEAPASCVGISKAVLLLTNGRIGPALDSRVRSHLGGSRPVNPEAWLDLLRDVSEDIQAFETRHGLRLAETVPPQFSRLECGRLYDMALGPRVSRRQ